MYLCPEAVLQGECPLLLQDRLFLPVQQYGHRRSYHRRIFDITTVYNYSYTGALKTA